MFLPDYPGATVRPHHYVWSGRRGGSVRVIVLHSFTGSADEFFSALEDLNDNTHYGVHYQIDRDGKVTQFVREVDTALSNGIVSAGHEKMWDGLLPGNPSSWTISIAHIKKNATDPLTPAQQEASFALIADICRRHQIPGKLATSVAEGGITSHASIDPVHASSCPGVYPWQELFAYLHTANTLYPTGVPAGWLDDGKALSVPGHNAVVTDDFREAVLAFGWNPENYPLFNAKAAHPCDPMHPESGQGLRQHFRDSILVWSSVTGKISQIATPLYLRAMEQTPAVTPAKKAKAAPASDEAK